MRIVSLLPSSTEIVAALGMADQLVARSHECDYPATVKNLPYVTAPKFDPDGRSYEIDQRVKAILQEAVAVYKVDADQLKALQPDVIITQSQCEVCAVSFEEVQRITCDWLDTDANLVALEPNALPDIFTDIQRVAEALGVSDRGHTLINTLKTRMDDIAQQAAPLNKPTVATIEWIDPLMAAGNWMPTLVEMAGGTNVFGEAGYHSPWVDFAQLQAADPDILVIIPCGYDMATSFRELPALTDRNGWQALKAVQTDQVYVADGNQYFNRPGPRIAESLEILAEIIHPSAFTFGHEGTGWQRLDVGLSQ